jgi:hypothetical protein
VKKLVERSIGKILRGGIVTTCSSLIIYFLAVMLSPVLPFIRLDNTTLLILFVIIYALTIITYFLLPPELSKNEGVENIMDLSQGTDSPKT